MPEIDRNARGSTLIDDFQAGEPESHTAIRLVDDLLFDILDPRTWVFTLDTIVTSLSNLCRFNGHIRNFYSVAEHSVRVSRMLEMWGESQLVQYVGLHHDDMEAYLGDCPSPHKGIMSIDGDSFKFVEQTLEYSYWSTLGVDVTPAMWKRVKDADLAVYLAEREERPILGQGLYPSLAKDQYLKLHNELITALNGEVEPF